MRKISWRLKMPFPQQTPREFTKAGIEALNPGQMGCYGLFKTGTWIYVGKGDIRQRLLDHLNGDNPCITRQSPTHFVSEVTRDYDNREKQLIAELDPICNKRVG
jgi:hypothetical protein